jgi:two-component system chemotaxis response regulator CheY
MRPKEFTRVLPANPPGIRLIGDNSGMFPEGDSPSVERPVLVVEDSENSAAMLEIALSDIPAVTIVLAPTALEAWRILNGEGPSICAIVTDLNMPRMDGFELIRRVRADGRLAAMPIVVVSADTDPATPRRIAQLGVNAFFAKPFSPAEVRRKLEQILNGKTD